MPEWLRGRSQEPLSRDSPVRIRLQTTFSSILGPTHKNIVVIPHENTSLLRVLTRCDKWCTTPAKWGNPRTRQMFATSRSQCARCTHCRAKDSIERFWQHRALLVWRLCSRPLKEFWQPKFQLRGEMWSFLFGNLKKTRVGLNERAMMHTQGCRSLWASDHVARHKRN